MRVGIIGAGPAGLAATFALARSAVRMSIVVFDKGRRLPERICPVDFGKPCKGCGGICNVISGFGGCMQCGDAIKLSRQPAGRRLQALLGDSYQRHECDAVQFFQTIPSDYLEGIPAVDKHLTFRQYPVALVGETRLSCWLQRMRETTEKTCDLREDSRVVEVALDNSGFNVVSSHDGQLRRDTFDILVIATGRSGITDARNWISRLGVTRRFGRPSIGIRIELPEYLLRPLYKVHRDFKISIRQWRHKIKSFCFCGTPGIGGRIKYCHYQDQFSNRAVFLDGHSKVDSIARGEVGNFALLAQIESDGDSSLEWLNRVFVPAYKKHAQGQPIWQPLVELGDVATSHSGRIPSIPFMRRGDARSFIQHDVLEDLVRGYDFVAKFASREGSSPLSAYWGEAVVMAPCIEFAWDVIETTNHFETSVRNLYAIGDCVGVAQGNLQAAIGGFAAAAGILAQ